MQQMGSGVVRLCRIHMATAQQLLDIARSQLGYQEIPVNHTKYNIWYYGKDLSEPWCAIFTSWCFNQVGMNIKYAYTPAGATYWQQQGRWHSSPQVGDVVFFAFNGS